MRISMLALAGLATLSGCAAEPPETIRVATFNAYLNRAEAGGLVADLSSPGNEQARAVAEIIQRTAPDILFLNEIDRDPEARALALFQENYLGVGQNGGAPAIYPYVYAGPVNTGLASGRDLDRNGEIVTTPGAEGYGGDAFGFGAFPGQYGMAILSKYPIEEAAIRTFQFFLWKDMPEAALPDDPETKEEADWHRSEALADFRLSSKSHWDIPVIVGGRSVHVLASHPTPPVFDGEENRNGRRNHDEIRFWADYVAGAAYIRDDAGRPGGLPAGARFVILGDMNADPMDGEAAGAIAQLLDHPLIAAAPAPESRGAVEAARCAGGVNLEHKTPAATDTGDFGDDPETGPGNLRLDYVLASKKGLVMKRAGVFWPAPDEDGYVLVGPGFPVVSSDHRLVWADLEIVD
ncbi:MAG: endonuclease/exonuclease/phosphatase family protein [Amphiplicatus sp.]